MHSWNKPWVLGLVAALAFVAGWFFGPKETVEVPAPVTETVTVKEVVEVPVYVETDNAILMAELEATRAKLREANILLRDVASHSLRGWDSLETVQKDRSAAMAWANANLDPYRVYDPVTGKARPLVDIMKYLNRKASAR